MTVIKPFSCIRPAKDLAARVAALPYDVFSRQEALEEVTREPLSFLAIDRAETQFPDSVGTYDPIVYKKARELLDDRIEKGIFVTEEKPSCYLYRLTMEGRSQTGIVACASVDDYINHIIKKHEETRANKEMDRICHVDVTNAHTGPIFLTYPSSSKVKAVTTDEMRGESIYDFTCSDGIRHQVWRISDPDHMLQLEEAFKEIPSLYIADGHHRAASAIKVAQKRREENPGYTGKEEFNYFLSVLFPQDELLVMPYNRVVSDLNHLSEDEFMERVRQCFLVKEAPEKPFQPTGKGQFGMFFRGVWYCLEAIDSLWGKGPIQSLDVSYLQDHLLSSILGIEDPKTDKRIAFVGGIRGLDYLEHQVEEGMAVAFSMYPTSVEELFAVADADLLMPPKSTWFEPKLRSGLFIHRLL